VLIFLALKSGIVDLGVLSDKTQTVYFYAVVAASDEQRRAYLDEAYRLGRDF